MVRPDSVPRKTFRDLREGALFLATHMGKDALFARELEHATLRALDACAQKAPR
jgi:hypothetical protein